MDKIGICICRVYCALNKLHTAGLSDKELEEVTDKVVSIIDKATHSRTPKFLNYKPKYDNDDEDNNEGAMVKKNKTKDILNKTSNQELNASPERENAIITDHVDAKSTKSKNKVVDNKMNESKEDKGEENKVKTNEARVVEDKSAEDKSTDKPKRVRWDCNSCINKCDKDKEDNVSICSECYRMYEKTGKTNSYYQRTMKEIPASCKNCAYISYNEDYGKYVCNVNYKLDGETGSYHHYIRANYLEKNRPGFCKCK